VTVDLSRLSGALTASCFNPRTGESQAIGRVESARREFMPPAKGPDWVLPALGIFLIPFRERTY
jgi:hypothetical protein